MADLLFSWFGFYPTSKSDANFNLSKAPEFKRVKQEVSYTLILPLCLWSAYYMHILRLFQDYPTANKYFLSVRLCSAPFCFKLRFALLYNNTIMILLWWITFILTLNQHITILINSFHTVYKLFKVNEKLEIWLTIVGHATYFKQPNTCVIRFKYSMGAIWVK